MEAADARSAEAENGVDTADMMPCDCCCISCWSCCGVNENGAMLPRPPRLDDGITAHCTTITSMLHQYAAYTLTFFGKFTVGSRIFVKQSLLQHKNKNTNRSKRVILNLLFETIHD